MQPAREFEHEKFNLFQAIVDQAPDAIIFAGRVVRSGVVAVLKSGLLLTVSNYAVGRICLHLAAMFWDREIKWHWSGIGRELSRFSVRRGAIAAIDGGA